MSNKKITIGTSDLKDALEEFADAWHKIEQGQAPQAPQAPVEKINFEDQRLLFKTLTPKRFEILEYAHQQNGLSIRALAKELGRDYSNVHQDVKILYQLGLMVKNEKDDKYYVPWDVIVTEISLPMIKKSKLSHHPKPRVVNG